MSKRLFWSKFLLDQLTTSIVCVCGRHMRMRNTHCFHGKPPCVHPRKVCSKSDVLQCTWFCHRRQVFLCCLSLGAIAWPSTKLKDKQASTQLSSLCTNSHRRLDLIPPLQQPLTSPSFVNERQPIQPLEQTSPSLFDEPPPTPPLQQPHQSQPLL